MQITAQALDGADIPLQPATACRAALTEAAFADDGAALAAGGCGWDLLCPYTFEATWNGGSRPEDVTISAPGFALSILGNGILSLALGYTFKIEPAHQLWVRGPTNQPKDGIAPIERLVAAELLPLVTAIHWRFTRPNQTIRFAAGEPFCTIVPYPAGYSETVRGVIHAASTAAAPAPLLPAVAPQVDATLPGVSCICCTYSRPALLEEAIESFLRQDYAGPKELIIINDFADQTLIYDHPQVRIINLMQRMHSVGEKINTAVALAAYDLICPWDDDDIYLPHRLRLSVSRLDPKRGIFKAAQAFFWNNGAISSIERNLFHAGACFTRALFDKAGGYPHQNSGYDMVLERAFDQVAFAATTPAELPAEQLYYFYRWAGTESYHISALQQQHDDARSYAEAAAFVARQVAAGAIPTGVIRLQPQWRHDYVALAQAFVAQYDPTAPPTVAPAAEAAPLDPPPIVFTHMPAPVAPEQAAGLFRGHAPRTLSVIIPAANESFYLQRTVEQFQATLPPNSEIIVVDNGSTDGCADFLAAAPAASPPDAPVAVRLLRTSAPLGVSRARNLGIAQSYGEVVVVADAHVDLPEGWWQPMVVTLNRPGVGLVGPGFTVLGNNAYPPACGQRIAEPNLRTEWLPFKGREAYPVPTLGGGFMAFRRETLHQVGMFDEGMVQWGAEDLEICLRIWLMGFEVWVMPDVAIPHYFRQKNPNKIEYYWVVHNTLRTAILHFGEERLARVLWAFSTNKLYPKAMALCADSDAWMRRAELQRTRRYNDDWFFAHPYFAQIDMDV
jgi:glycosyltransferase involved in cell wall biosynthesis